MVKDIKLLPKDLRKLITEARAEAAAEIQESLMNRSPFWTGTFAESWIVSGTEVQATRPRQGEFDPDQDEKPMRLPSSIFRDTSQKGKRIYQALTSPVFIGNETDDVYTQSKEIFKDIDKGFLALNRGFTTKTTKPAGTY